VIPARLSLLACSGDTDPSAGCVRANAARTAARHGPGDSRRDQAEDCLLALLLTNTWRLTTGRMLRSDVPPAQLSSEELINFWADDHTVRPVQMRTSATPSECAPHGRRAMPGAEQAAAAVTELDELAARRANTLAGRARPLTSGGSRPSGSAKRAPAGPLAAIGA
jgi:hypothetical protein